MANGGLPASEANGQIEMPAVPTFALELLAALEADVSVLRFHLPHLLVRRLAGSPGNPYFSQASQPRGVGSLVQE